MSQTMAAPPLAERIRSVDILRGLVMILMALDHVRDFWAPSQLPEDMDEPGLALFMTRWVTHFCAPIFVFLAGTSAFLYQRNTGCSDRHLSWFLFTRGFWLVIVELTIVGLGWGTPFAGFSFLQVIWAIGVSMMVLSVLVYLPTMAVAAIGIVMILGHNLLDGITAATMEPGFIQVLWMVLHDGGWIPLGGPPPVWGLWIAYPLVPWIGVMATGFAFGQLLSRPREVWDRNLLLLGGALIVAWLVLRSFNIYGDPVAWAPVEGDAAQSLINFLNVEKYPPSLLFLLMTLGPALLVMPFIENWRGRFSEAVTVFGRVPFFYYVLHLPLIHITAAIYSMARYGATGWWFMPADQHPPDYEHNLWLAYGVWVAVVLVLYPACKWYASLKRRRKDWWLSYL
jgi:uncharacterized membrane protein